MGLVRCGTFIGNQTPLRYDRGMAMPDQLALIFERVSDLILLLAVESRFSFLLPRAGSACSSCEHHQDALRRLA